MLNGRLEFRLLNKPSLLPGGSYLSIYFQEFSSLFIAPHILLLHLCNRRNFLWNPPPNFAGSCLLSRFNRRSGRHSFTQLYFNPSNRGVLVVEYKNDFLYPSVFTEASMLCCVVLCSTIIIVIIIIIINVVFLLDLLDDTLTRKRRTVLFLGTTHTRDFVPFVLPV